MFLRDSHVVTNDHNHTGAGDGGVLTNDIHDGYVDIGAIATPVSPSTNYGRIFTRLNGANIELVWISALGNECIICTLPNTDEAATLSLNWVE